MMATMDAEGFGACTNHGECQSAYPKGINVSFITRLNRDFIKPALTGAEESTDGDGGSA